MPRVFPFKLAFRGHHDRAGYSGYYMCYRTVAPNVCYQTVACGPFAGGGDLFKSIEATSFSDAVEQRLNKRPYLRGTYIVTNEVTREVMLIEVRNASAPSYELVKV